MASIVQAQEDDHMVDDNQGGSGPSFLKEGPDLSGRTNVRRPAAAKVDPATDEFTFMQIDTDYYTTIPPGKIKQH